MQRLEVSGAVRPIYGSLGVKRLTLLYKVTQLSEQLMSLEETRGWERSYTCQPNTCFNKADNTHCRLQQNQAAALLGKPDADMQEDMYLCASISTNFLRSFHCSESAVCADLSIETSTYGDVVTRQHFLTTCKPPIFSRTFVITSNLSSKSLVSNRMQHAFTKFTCA